ncbi:hypothetical protein ACQKKX_20575, partial [Neorhizobium sp. NPDC001467]|uniref:hypothetical protein n=1 Tax=Neorhizobium sp. NPDC001467 TaxID=3390595 RepID=UPI003CFCE4CF
MLLGLEPGQELGGFSPAAGVASDGAARASSSSGVVSVSATISATGDTVTETVSVSLSVPSEVT